MKKQLIFILLLVLAIAVSAGEWKPVSSSTPQAGKALIVNADPGQPAVRFTIPGFNLNPVTTPRGLAYTIRMDGSTPILEKGAPDLPKMTVSLVIPDQADMEAVILSHDYMDFPDIEIAPSKGVIMRDTDPSTVPYTYGPAYNSAGFYPAGMTGMREPHIIRDFRGQTLIFNPFHYDPSTKVLRVYYDVTIGLKKVSDNGTNVLALSATQKRVPASVLPELSRHFMNFDGVTYTAVEEYGNLLVICHGPFMTDMQPYVDWKRASGYKTEMLSTDSVGTTSAQIKSFIANYYNTKGLTHVLLVGDKAQIPTNTGSGLGGPSDNAYGYISGTDHYSDVYIGRFSSENVDHVQTQVQRTISYETDPQFVSDDWYTTVIGIASNQGPGDDNEMDYEHIRNQQSQLLAYKYTMNPELFDGSQGGNDAPGNPTPPMVATEVNNGASLILYTGHGSNNAWSTSGFSSNNVNQLTNQGKLPFIWSVACVNGNFTSGTCFAEAWLRASQNGEPTGAIAFLGSTINQSWDSPMEGQDEMTDILAESYPGNLKRTFAGISISGCMKMIDSYGLDGQNMADTWTVFGDPTVMVRTSNPVSLAIIHDTVIFTGDSLLALTGAPDGARATLTVADSILSTGLFANDSLTLDFPAFTMPGDTIRLVVTAYNHIPYQYYIPVQEMIILPVKAGFTATPEWVVPGNTVAFADTSSGTVLTWAWSFPGGIPSESTEQNPVVTYNERGMYDVRLIVGNGLMLDTLTLASFITCDFPAAVPSAVNDKLVISPNPATGTFIVSLPVSSDLPSMISVSDLAGRVVWQSEAIPANGKVMETISLNEAAKGIYLVKIRSNDVTTTSKVVIR